MRADATVTPFRIDISETALVDLAERLSRAPLQQPGRVNELLDLWRQGFDWREWEARLNTHPQFTTEIDGQRIHFLHVRSAERDTFPLILTHGWPGTVVEYLDVIAPLTAQGFDLVIPSIPGFAFSGPASGWNRYRTARAWAELMRRLGYESYGAVGNDVGATISLELGREDPEHVTGIHVTQIFSLPADPHDAGDLIGDDHERLERSTAFIQEHGAYLRLHATRPDTLAPALTDSPVGLLGWNAQLLESVDPAFALANITIYWLTGTGASAIRFYHEDARVSRPGGPTSRPVGLAEFTGDFFASIRRFAHRDHTSIVSWNTYPGGGHYAAHQAPSVLAQDITGFFRSLAHTATA
ncbi:epoxide hydrolase family protein [Actinomadura rudentiformis]|uniref:Epoxide hydrolase 1 n=1 Tax=Actinomadura rudentiformis TaxID=359158 RepID=A0A6H9ZA94_9ACTN|nr:epoxide hydrolase family protein [Actinomadura rudentiformis]KAB2352393.1 epoxide hydrolase 1 [Actinomadura rudentiformis]